MPRQKIEELQLERLKRLVDYCMTNIPFYNKRLTEAGVTAEKIKSLKDIEYIPYTTKADIRDTYPFGLFGQPMKKIVRIHASSGTTGKPTVVGYTKNDLENWSDCMARLCCAAGATDEDIVQIAFGYGLFTGALGLHYGLEKLGATVVPTSSGNTEKQIMLMQDFGSTVLACTPSYALRLAEAIHQSNKVSIYNMKLRVGFFGAEPWTEGMRKELQRKLHIKAYDIYGLTEMCGPGVGGECEYQKGTHLWEDMFYPEIINPDTLEPCAPGEFGELVFTSLCKEAMPILRYRTRDLTRLVYDRCECGRTAVRMDRILGRSDDMMIIRGVNVFPSQIETVLTEFTAFTPYYFITVDRINNEDTFDLDVELRPEFFSASPKEQMPFIKPLYDRIVSLVGIKPNIHIKPPFGIERSTGKAKHVLDKRNFHN